MCTFSTQGEKSGVQRYLINCVAHIILAGDTQASLHIWIASNTCIYYKMDKPIIHSLTFYYYCITQLFIWGYTYSIINK